MLIISADPGKKTGVATWSDKSHGDFIPEGFHSFEATVDEFFTFMGQVSALAATSVGEVRFVSESFLITVNTAKNSQAGWSLELIGVIKYVAKMWFDTDVTLQTPSVGKTFGTDVKLKYVGWFKKGNGHANDAARHLMTYAATRGLVFTNEQLQGFALA